MDVSRISPAPRSSPSRAQSTASRRWPRPARARDPPPRVDATTTACEPSRVRELGHSPALQSAALFTDTLSAPLEERLASRDGAHAAADVNGIASVGRRTKPRQSGRPSSVAFTSR
jgi:hypothetical protein